MKRKVLAALLCGALSVSMMACQKANSSTEQTESESSTTSSTEAAQTETTEEQEPEVVTYWDKVGIVDFIGTVYNGATVQLEKEEVPEGENYIVVGRHASYAFEDPADFYPLAEAVIEYQDAKMEITVPANRDDRLHLSGNYELVETSKFNTYGRNYELHVDGKQIARFEVEGENANSPIEECKLYSFQIYPTEGLVYNGYEFKDINMENVVKYFGNPNGVSFSATDEEDKANGYEFQSIDYYYNESNDSYINSCRSEVAFYTTDGLKIDTINFDLNFTKEEILAMQEWEVEEEDASEDNKTDELISDLVSGRDGSQEKPYLVGDKIHFKKVMLGYNGELLQAEYTPLTITVEEANSEHVKVKYDFGVNNWEELNWKEWSAENDVVAMDSLIAVFRFDSNMKQIGNPLDLYNSKNNDRDIYIMDADKTTVTLYYQDYEGGGITSDTKYLLFIYNKFSIPENEHYPYFNCTFVEVK